MSSNNPPDGIKITLEDLDAVQVAEAAPKAETSASSVRSYGTLKEASDQSPAQEHDQGSVFLKAWFYLGAAGLVGSLIGWAITEPGFSDLRGEQRWGNWLMIPVLISLMSLGLGIAESLVERSMKKAILRTALSLPLGLILGFVLSMFANIVFNILVSMCVAVGVQSSRSPLFWIARSIAWTVLGATGGLVYGIVGQSFKKGKYGVLGGILGAFIGGLLFDPISMATGSTGAALSRAVGFGLFGMATGAMMGLVESALKDRWLYVTAGPLAGKQFILYKPQTTVGSNQTSDIYLFKDPSILPNHLTMTANGTRMTLHANGPVLVSGVSVSNRVLLDGDLVQIGRYTFRYKEKARG